MKVITLSSQTEKKILTATLKVLKQGGLVVFPSDTVYGLLGDATNEKTVQKLLKFKNRPPGKAVSVFTTWEGLTRLVKVEKSMMERLRKLLPGPYTIILPSRHKTSRFLESEDKTLGVRIPDHPLVNVLVSYFGKPITATSANLSGRSPHYSISSFFNTLSERKKKLIDLVVDAGTLPRNKPSTVADMTTSKVKILRKGDTSFFNKEMFTSNSEKETKKIAQGFLKKILKNKLRRPVTIIVKGDLGAGKTIFVKGISDYLGVKNIISPTYVVMYEYPVKHSSIKKLIHYDLYTVTDPEEFRHLGIEQYLEGNNLLCFEWGEKAGNILPLLRSKTRIIVVQIEHKGNLKRKITISF